jgi:hypothetical protein
MQLLLIHSDYEHAQYSVGNRPFSGFEAEQPCRLIVILFDQYLTFHPSIEHVPDYIEFEAKRPTKMAEEIEESAKKGRLEEALCAFVAVNSWPDHALHRQSPS